MDIISGILYNQMEWSEYVPEGLVCPHCGEYRLAWLAWNIQGTEILCCNCDRVYDVERYERHMIEMQRPY